METQREKRENQKEEEKKLSLKQKVFSSESVYASFVNRIADIVVLHFIVLIFSLPVFTIGAAITAANYTGMKLAGGMEGYVAGNFVKAFKENFKRSTLYFLMMAAAGAAIYISFRYWFSMNSAVGMLFGIMTIVLAFVWLLIFLYLFAVQAKFSNTFTATLKNSLLMAVRHLHITILMLLVLGVFVYFIINFRFLQVVSVVSGMGALAFVFGKLYNIVFKNYM